MVQFKNVVRQMYAFIKCSPSQSHLTAYKKKAQYAFA